MIPIFHGSGITEFDAKRPKDIQCHHCGAIGKTFVRKYSKTWHLSFIPLFPVWIVDEFECVHCNSVLQFREMDSELKRHYRPFKSRRVPPWWNFSGVVIALIIIGWSSVSYLKKQSTILDRIEHIEAERILDIETEEGKYSTVKVCSVSDDYVAVVFNKFEAEIEKDLSRIDAPNNYSRDTIELERSILQEWVQEGRVKDVHW